MPSRSDDLVAAAIATAADAVAMAVLKVGMPNPVVLLDGRSGAGKSTLAQLVARLWPLQTPVQLIELDALYPGWDGLDAGVQRALDGVLRPRADGAIGRWHGWNWLQNRDLDEVHDVDPDHGLILDGCGVITPETAAMAEVRVWVQSPDEVRKKRALDRDGDAFRPYWDRWAAQEAVHIARDDPQSLATLVVQIP